MIYPMVPFPVTLSDF